MYRKQMALQRALCILMVVASALVFIYALGYMTDVYDMIYTLRDKEKTDEIKQFLADMDLFDSTLVKVGIGMILVSLTLLLTNSHTRRKYYIGNYAATVLTAGAAFGVAAWGHRQVDGLKQLYYSGIIDFEVVKNRAEKNARNGGISVYTESAFWFDVHYFVFGILLLAAVLLILNAIWKSILMKREKDALKMGKAVS